jgi:hypothetical protein
MPFSASSLAASSGMVMSGSASTHPIRASRWGASLPPPGGRPCRSGSTEPVRATRAASLTAKLALTLKRSAADRRDCPTLSPHGRAFAAQSDVVSPCQLASIPRQHLESDVRSDGNPPRFQFQARCSNGRCCGRSALRRRVKPFISLERWGLAGGCCDHSKPIYGCQHVALTCIPGDVTAIPEGLQEQPRLTAPDGVLQGRTSRGIIGYYGPRPPVGDKPHRYHFQILALDGLLDVPAGADRDMVPKAASGRVIPKASWSALMRRL